MADMDPKDLDPAVQQNSIVEIKKFLQDTENPPTTAEFSEFWTSLTEEEKAEFKNTPLP